MAIKRQDKPTRVVVAMSGGVDSSVAAVLLKQQGFDVVGMMLRLWSEPGKEDSNRCCSPDALAMARRVAAQIDIPFYSIDAKEVFRSTVVQSFLDGYSGGLTPNPCLVCNRTIRWKYLLDHALAIGADYLATGHYVRLIEAGGKKLLLRATDPFKDQSYVLHVLNQEQLEKAIFPIGDHPKEEIRQIARSNNLPVATRADSQDLCFLAGEDYRAFLKRHRPEIFTAGEIVTRQGKILGKHDGLANYTIGQRKGLQLSSAAPVYVLAKDLTTNRLIVGGEDELGSVELVADRVNWIAGEPPGDVFRAEVKTRYTALPAPAEISLLEAGKKVKVIFDHPNRGITPGQAAVFYLEEKMLGGGEIL